ncbi:S-methyl-5-thioribose-1-phosphate isomerase [bacterium]|nr:MAG: S-methyl-5-thioribose-1-phosphate isomerase [bacterium]
MSTISWKNSCVRIIDQTKLPLRLEYIDCRNAQCVWDAIKELKVRGAPAIGIAGAFGVVLGIGEIKTNDYAEFKEGVDRVIDYLASSRPTAVNLFWALKRMQDVVYANYDMPVRGIRRLLFKEAEKILEEDKGICRKMADFGSRLIKNGDCLLTICNAGALATADYGTALGVFYRAKEKAKNFKVFACETRPLMQGSRLTAWELKKHSIDVTLIADNTAGLLAKEGKISKVFVGADRIAANGDTANKIGTFNLSLVSFYHKIPFYVVAPSSTFDLNLKSGKRIPIEHRKAKEVLELQSKKTTSPGIKVYNPAFDVTPHRYISGFVTEKGLIYPPFERNIRNALT